MKKVILIIIISVLGITGNSLKAQIRFNFNIGSQPIWGPVGYDHVENYYLPDIDAYYNVDSRQYTYIANGRWINTTSLPWRYRNYDLYHGYKVVMNGPRPYLNYDRDRVKYAQYRNQHDQQPIRDSRDQKYFENRNHPEHQNWRGDDKNNQRNRDQKDNGRGRGRGRGNEKDRD
jgi:hypothetical protein